MLVPNYVWCVCVCYAIEERFVKSKFYLKSCFKKKPQKTSIYSAIELDYDKEFVI